MGKLYLFLASLLLMLTSSALKAQDSEFIELTLNKMFELADSRNSEISVFETAALKAEEDMQGVKNQYLPSIKASLSFSYNGDGTITDRNFSNSFSVPIPSFGNSFSLEVSQLIYNGGAVKGSIDMAKIQTEVAHLQSKNKLQEVRFMIVGNFMDLCKIENNILVFESHIIQTEKQLSHMQLRYNEGAALLNDITRFELKLQNLQHTLIELKNSKQILNNQLTQALGLPISVTIKPIRSWENKIPDYTSSLNAYELLQTSQVLEIANKEVDISEQREKITRAGRYPTIALFAANHLNGPVTIDIPAINKNFNYWAVGVGVQYNIDNLFKNGRKERSSKLATVRAEEEQKVTNEQMFLAVETAIIRYKEAFSLLETRNKSLELASDNYNVINYRYDNDLAMITDLLDASTQKLEAELQATNAQINIIYQYYKLKFISGTL